MITDEQWMKTGYTGISTIKDLIADFAGPHWYMSNFSDHPVLIDGTQWPTVEHWFHSRKNSDVNYQLDVLEAKGPGEAKALGQEVLLRPDWEEVKERVMWVGLVAKFTQHRGIRYKLIATGGAVLIEGNSWHDNYWGECDCDECQHSQALNRLGEQLMLLRHMLKIEGGIKT